MAAVEFSGERRSSGTVGRMPGLFRRPWTTSKRL